MKVALVHDYLKEFGGAERVLMVLHEMFPDAPIYTAFVTPGSTAEKQFEDKLREDGSNAKIITSWANIFIRNFNLFSPLRFLVPLIWESFDFSGYDLVILSSSGYLTKPARIPRNVRVICYCHTPPRFLYGYQTALEWQRYWPVKIYGYILGHFLRLYDFLGAQRVDQFIANSHNVAARIKKFYRKNSVVVYPPVETSRIAVASQGETPRASGVSPYKRGDLGAYPAKGGGGSQDSSRGEGSYFLVVGRIAGAKGVDLAMEAANKLGVPLKIVGEYAGIKWEKKKIENLQSSNVEFLGRVPDNQLYNLYAHAKAFLAIGHDEDFGITPVEGLAAGTPVVAYASGGYLETIIEGKTGTFFAEYNAESLAEAMERVQGLKFKVEDLRKQAEKFSRERFIKEIKSLTT